MKIAICFLLYCTTAFAFHSWSDQDTYRQPSEYASAITDELEEQQHFRHGVQKTYIYNGQAMTGIPGTSKQHSGNRLQARVTVTCRQSSCVMQMHQTQMGRLNRHVKSPKNVLPMSGFEPIPLESQQRHKLQFPVKFSNNNGELTNLYFDGKDQPWSANIKRGVLSLLQVKLQPKEVVSMDIVDEIEDRVMNAYKPSLRDAQFYRTVEETIEGKCEVVYTVTTPAEFKRSRKEIVNVTKTINFENCQKRPQVKLNFHFSKPCKTCENKYTEDQKFLKSSSISSYQVIKTKKSYVIDNAHTESQYIFVPFNEETNTIVTYVSQNIQLVNIGTPMQRIQVPRNPIKSNSDMLYNMDDVKHREHFQMTGDSTFLAKYNNEKLENKVQLAKNLLKKLVNNFQEQVQEPATARFTELVNLLRWMTRREIEQVHNEVIERGSGQHNQASDLFHDALGSAATMTTVQHLVQKIKQREIPVNKAVSAIKNLMIMRVPSQQIIDELISLAESQVSQRHYSLKQATWLTVGSLMNILCSSNFDQFAFESQENFNKYCPTSLKQHYVRTLAQKLHSSHKWDDQLIYVKALGNAAIDLGVFELEKIINNKNFNYHNMIRIESIVSLRQLSSIMPRKIQKILMPIVSNKLQPEALRISAALILLKTIPNRSVLDQLVNVVQNGRSLQLTSFVDSYMHILANSTNPCEKRLANDLKLSLRQSHKIYARPATSKLRRLQLQSSLAKVGLDLDLITLFSNESPIPHQWAASLHANYLGLWKKCLVSVKFSSEGLEKLFEQGSYNYKDNSWKLNSESTESWNRFMSPIDNILGQEYSNAPSSEPKAVLSLKMHNQDVEFLPLKREAIESMLMFGQPTGRYAQGIEEQLRQGMSINYNKATMLEEIFYKIPTTMGVPVMVHVKVPAVVNVHGAIKMTPSTSGSLGSMQIKAVLKPSLVASISIDAQVWSPIVATGVNVVSKMKLFKPIDAKVQLNVQGETKVVKLLFTPPTQKKDLITIETRPSTFTIVQPKQVLARQAKQKRLILGEEGNRVNTVNTCGTSEFLGSTFCIKGRYHKTPKQTEHIAPSAPMSGPNKIVISVQPSTSRPNIVAVNFYGKFLQAASSTSLQSHLFNSLPISSWMSNSEVDNLMRETEYQNRVHPSNRLFSDRISKRPLLNNLRIEIENGQGRSTFDLLHVFNMDGDYQKVYAKLSESPTPQNPNSLKMCFNYESIFPTLKMTRQLRDQQIIGKMSLNWGSSCNSPNFIHVVKRVEKGHQSRLHELENPEWNVQRDASWQQGQLLHSSPLKHIMEIKYNNVPLPAREYANQLLNFVRNHLNDQTKVAETRVQNRPQHIKVIFAYDPVTLKKCDVLIKTPQSNTLIQDLLVPSYACPITHTNDYLANEMKSLTRQFVTEPSTVQCYATEYTLKTFQDSERPMPQSQSYKVLSQDCTNNQYTVLVRRLASGNDEMLMEVKIVTPQNQITLKPFTTKTNRMQVFINGHDYTEKNNIVKTEAGLPILKIVKESSHVKVEILTVGVSVYFDRKSVNVEVPPHKQHDQCGLCSTPSYQTSGFQSSQFEQEIENEIERENPVSEWRDFSSTEDVLSHYFRFNPLNQRRNFWQNEQTEEELLIESGSRGWNFPQEPSWEIDEKLPTSDRNEQQNFGTWTQMEQMNEEFTRFYSPLRQIEQQINEELSRDSWQSSNLALVEEEFFKNPYLSQNFMINDQSCQYMPFWQQQENGCQDVFSQFHSFTNQQSNLLEESLMEENVMEEIDEIENENQENRFLTSGNRVLQETMVEELMHENSRQQPGNQYKQKNNVVETEHSICFSKQPMKCPDDFYTENDRTQTVQYVCLSRQNPLAQKFLNEIMSGKGQVPQLRSMPTTMTRREVVPTRCQSNF